MSIPGYKGVNLRIIRGPPYLLFVVFFFWGGHVLHEMTTGRLTGVAIFNSLCFTVELQHEHTSTSKKSFLTIKAILDRVLKDTEQGKGPVCTESLFLLTSRHFILG